MRIIAGLLGGRSFNSSSGHKTHPMGDKVRGALFNTLGDITNLTVLDPFAGSGALSFEAVSRGAKQALAIDSDRRAQQTLSENITSLDLSERVKLVRASANAWLSTNDQLFDLVLCDPPYDDIKPQLLNQLAARAKSGAIIVFSLPPTAEVSLIERQYELLTHKDYGDATLWFYRRAN